MGITTREKPKGSGRWRLFYNKGGRTREMPGFTFKTEAAAKETAEKLRARLSLGLSIHDLSKDAPSIDQYALGWLERMKRQVKANTLKTYSIAVRRQIIPYFRSRAINEIRPADVRAFIDHLAESGVLLDALQRPEPRINGVPSLPLQGRQLLKRIEDDESFPRPDVLNLALD